MKRIFLILVFPYPIFFCLSFSVFYFPSVHLFSLSLCISFYFFLCLLYSFLADFYFLSLPVFYYISLNIHFSSRARLCVWLLFSCPSFLYFLPFNFLSPFSAYFSIFFFLFCFSYFVLFSILFNYLVLILDYNYCNCSLLFIFSINLCYLLPSSLAVFLTKCEAVNFFSF